MSPKKSNQLDLRIRLLTATIAGCFLLGSLLIVPVDLNLAYSQTPNNLDENNGDDLSEAVAPAFDFNNNFDKSIVVLLNFTEINKAEFVDSDVSYGPPHSNIGNPPSLRVQIYDYSGGIIQQFNYWHPLFYFEFQEGGNEYLNISQNSAVGRFVFAFDPNAALMKVSYLHHDGVNSTWAEEIILVDLIPTISRFCDQFRDDPDCRSSDLSVVDVSTSNGQQQLPLLIGSSADVTVQTTVTNTGPDAPIDAALSSKIITPSGSDGVLVTPAAGATTIVTPLNEREQYDQTYTIECWEPGIHNILFESEIASQSGAVDDANQLNNKGQMNFEVDCRVNGVLPPAEPLSVSIEANATEDGSPPTTIDFRAITVGGTQPYKFRWNFDDGGSNNNNDVKGDQLMTYQFTRLGQYNVTVSVTDSANGFRGQTASDNIVITISDTVPPQISVPPNIIVEATGPNGISVIFTVSATDIVDGSVPVRCDRASGSIFQIGTTNVNCEARDNSGNIGYDNFTVTVQDTTAPTLTVPPSITVEASGPSTSVTYPPATATDTVDPSPIVECFPLSPITIARVGSQIVTCKASDNSGNSANGTFTVTVQDTTAPEIIVIYNDGETKREVEDGGNITVIATDPNGVSAKFIFNRLEISATDIVDGSVEVSCSSPGFTFPVGDTRVSCLAFDAAKNTGTKSFTVTVRPPVSMDPGRYGNVVP
jgi:hypothetical protein